MVKHLNEVSTYLLLYEKVGDVRRLRCNSSILVSLRVLLVVVSRQIILRDVLELNNNLLACCL